MANVFVALDLPGAARATLDEVMRNLHGRYADVRWVPAANLHITLAFLGEIEPERVEHARAAMEHAAARTEPGSATLAGLGGFPRALSARVIWAGVDDPDARVEAAASALRAPLEDAGFPLDDRPFRPHVTLGRSRTSVRVPVRSVRIRAEPLPVGSLALYATTPGPSGVRYELLHRAPLADRPA